MGDGILESCIPIVTSRKETEALPSNPIFDLRSGNRSPGKWTFRGSLIDENMFAIDVREWGMDNLIEEYRAQRQPKLLPPKGVTCPVGEADEREVSY